MSDLPKHVGPFEIRDRLGQGGMGMVYLAYDPMLDRSVAVKVLRVPDDETRRRFLREARLHAKVQHPHIVNIYAVGEHESQPYLAMEYIAGSTLAAIVRNGEDVPLARKVTWLAELSAGLDHAHRYGVVHRDVKPSNILIARETGRLRLLDFGIAHGQEAMGMTMAGMVIGTPQYMSPEQITGKPVDARSDIFSVGLVGYELLTGRQAFGGDNVFDISRRIVGEPPPELASACRDAPSTLLRIIEKCIEKSPDDRYQDGRQLERELMSVARRLDPDHTLVSVPLTAPTAVLESQSDEADDPTTGAAALAVRVREAVGSGRLAEAEQLLRDLKTRHSRVPGLSGLRVLVEEARQMSQAVDLAADAERALARAHLTEAQALINDIERLAPSWSGVSALRRQLQTQQNERRIADVVQMVTASLDASRLDDAEPALRELAALSPTHPELGALRSRYHARIAEQQAASLASRARTALQQDQLDDAAALVAEALAIAPRNEDALSVQELVGQRRRAQRLARAAQKVQAALDAGQPVSARKAFDQLLRMDPGHPDLDMLRARVERLERGEDADTTSGVRALPSMVALETPLPVDASPPLSSSALVTLPALSSGAISLDDDDDLHFSRPGLPGAEHANDGAGEAASRPRPVWMLPAAALLLALVAIAGWFMFGRAPATSATDMVASAGADVPSSGAGLDGMTTLAETSSDGGRVEDVMNGTDASKTETESAEPDPTAGETSKRAAVKADPTAEGLRRVQQLVSAGRYPAAFAALAAVPGLPAASVPAEQRRVAEAAREGASVARRAAADFGATRADAFVQGGSRLQLAEDHFKAGRMEQAVTQYDRARDEFQTALATRTSQAANAGGPLTTNPSGAGADTATADAAKASGAAAAMATWKNDQAVALLQQFRSAYEGRQVAAIQQLWPAMDPASERRFRGIFGTPGELQWIPLSQKVVRLQDRFSVTASVRSVTPLTDGQGQDSRDVTVTLEIAPQGNGLVITSFRQR